MCIFWLTILQTFSITLRIKSKVLNMAFSLDSFLFLLPFSLHSLLSTLKSMLQSSWTTYGLLSHLALSARSLSPPVSSVWHILHLQFQMFWPGLFLFMYPIPLRCQLPTIEFPSSKSFLSSFPIAPMLNPMKTDLVFFSTSPTPARLKSPWRRRLCLVWHFIPNVCYGKQHIAGTQYISSFKSILTGVWIKSACNILSISF